MMACPSMVVKKVKCQVLPGYRKRLSVTGA